MRRALLCLLLSGCFDEAGDPTEPVVVAPMPIEDESSSSSGEPDASSSEDESSSGVEDVPGPPVCPEWCHNGCDAVLGVAMLCRCVWDPDCGDGTACDREDDEPMAGHCV